LFLLLKSPCSIIIKIMFDTIKKDKPLLLAALLLALPLAIFGFHMYHLNFTQDDTYIFLRYAKNFVNGHGLVFNIGERVEGYTSFSWLMLLIVALKCKLDPLIVAKTVGIICGGGSMIILFLIGRAINRERSPFFALIAPCLLAANGAFALWTTSGMETALFNFLIIAGVYSYLLEHQANRMNFITPFIFALAALTRPEGIFVFSMTVLHRGYYVFIKKDFSFRQLGAWIGFFVLLVLPHIIWRLWYYGHPFPNSFYAKTGASAIYLKMGLSYTAIFLGQYGLWGAALVVPIIGLWLMRQRPAWLGYFTLMMGGWICYITSAGGDVLVENRFYIPVILLMYLTVQEFCCVLPATLLPGWKKIAGTVIICAVLPGLFAWWTWWNPCRQIEHSRRQMDVVVYNYSELARWVNLQKGPRLTIATTGVGALSYNTDVTIIDMFGLNDEYIAHHPQYIPGLISPCREQTYNADYVLSRRPDYIYFILNARPTALAEKALFASPVFRQGYYLYNIDDHHYIYKLKKDFTRPTRPDTAYASIDFIEVFAMTLRNADSDTAGFQRAIELGPGDFGFPYQGLGQAYTNYPSTENGKKAVNFFRKALAIDDYCSLAHLNMASFYFANGFMSDARREVERSISVCPALSDAHALHAQVLCHYRQYQQAADEFLLAGDLSNEPDKKGNIIFNLGAMYYSTKEYDLALVCFEEYLNFCPHSADAEKVAGLIQELRAIKANSDTARQPTAR
jgi:tetratricopeptide (TPR) repeat protein